MNENVKEGESRIIYIEPNDAMDDINGVPMTPDYPDLCIAFNLIVEVVPRFKTNAAEGEDYSGRYCMYWRSKPLENGTNPYSPGTYVSFLTGKDGFLTTYYTDTNYEDVVRENIVEGLGVENVTVAFENYYTPTVTIKFVDQRGSSLFGREEATHHDDKLTIDNIFGAFFTAPYPKFKLQIKGFYGQAVTLQLTCSGFKGNLNSQTGNFEATATFIGYSYSLLTDIPFQYIVAAPFCEYVGNDYWKQNMYSPEWSLGGQPMITLYDLMAAINAAMTNSELLKALTEGEEEIIRSGETEKEQLKNVLGAYNRFKDVLKLGTGGNLSNYTGTNIEDEQLLLFNSNPKIELTNEIKGAWTDLLEYVEKYNEDYPSNEIPKSSMPNEVPVSAKENSTFPELAAVHIFDIDSTEDGVETISLHNNKDYSYTINDVSNLQFNTNGNSPRKLSASLAERLKVAITPGSVESNILEYAYLFDFHDFSKRIEDRFQYIDNEAEDINKKAERNYVELAKAKLGVVPYIGNIFKIIMAHIETFVFIMYSLNDRVQEQIARGERTPSRLRVATALADVKTNRKINYVPVWPLVSKKNVENDPYGEKENENTIGWVGDFSSEFEEEKLVRALFLACKKTTGSMMGNREKETNVTYVPITPCDVNMIENVFQGNIDTGLSSLAGMLGIRTAQLFGIMEKSAIDNSVAKVMGRMDAYNYYMNVRSKSEIKSKILDAAGNKSLADKLYDIMLCKSDEDSSGDTYQGNDNIQRHKFETVRGVITKVKEERHPIYSDNGQVLKYIHYYNKKHHAFVPSVVMTFGLYNQRYTYQGGRTDNPYFEYTYANNTIADTLLNCNSEDLLTEEQTKDYINEEMFNVEVDSSKVEGILKRYEELKTKNFKIFGQEYSDDFIKVLDRYWRVDDGEYKKTIKSIGARLSKKYEDIGIEKTNWGEGDNSKVDGSYVGYSGDDQWSDSLTTDSLVFPSLNVWGVDDNNEHIKCSLFGSYLYYLQNRNNDKDTRDKVKALMILHAIVSPNNIPKLDFYGKSKTHGSVQITTVGYLLLLGGLLWRRRFMPDNANVDPIIWEFRDTDYKVDFLYKPASKDNTLYFNNGKYTRFTVLHKDNKNEYNVSILSLLGGTEIDHHIENALINRFNEFAKGECQTLINKLELRKKGQNHTESISATMIYNLFKELKLSESTQKVWAERKKVADATFLDFSNAYSYYSARKLLNTPFLLYFNEDETTSQNILKRLYCGKAIIMDTCANTFVKGTSTSSPQGNNTDVSVQSSNVKAYLEGFDSALKSITESISETVIDNSNESDTEHGDIAEFDRDVAVPIYMYLKMVWDKWLVASDKMSPYDSEYSVKNFFNNFVFIDSFYRNIAYRFMMNCQILLDRYEANNVSTRDYSVFKYIGDITTDHHCMFLAVPDFIDDMSAKNRDKARAAMNSIFTPVPYDKMRDMDLNNKFVIIYVPKLSETPSEINNYEDDSFNIWSYTEKDGIAPKILKMSNNTSDDLSAYGYYVPSFGLTYGRQHNHLFKNLNLNMETPIITSAVINTLSHISKMGAANSHAVAFIGQDIYPVFSNYSYICEFEMMGCAQIQPLMYFQLMNVPMWRGTYMIFNVTHTMTPGNMVTRVKAMKLSNRAVPYSNAWFKKNLNYDPDSVKGDGDCDGENTASNGAYNPEVYRGQVTQKKYIDLMAVLKSRSTGTFRRDRGGIAYITSKSQSICAQGPKTWIEDGLKAASANRSIRGSLRPTAWKNRGNTPVACAFDQHGFRCVASFSTPEALKKYKPQVCDIATYFTSSSQHMCMWDGKNWVSDFLQNGIYVYGNTQFDRSKQNACIWRFDDALWAKQHGLT